MKYVIDGKRHTAKQIAEMFGITTNAVVKRYAKGWGIVDGEFVHPIRKKKIVKVDIIKKLPHLNSHIGKNQYRKMLMSFVGDPEIADDLYC